MSMSSGPQFALPASSLLPATSATMEEDDDEDPILTQFVAKHKAAAGTFICEFIVVVVFVVFVNKIGVYMC